MKQQKEITIQQQEELKQQKEINRKKDDEIIKLGQRLEEVARGTIELEEKIEGLGKEQKQARKQNLEKDNHDYERVNQSEQNKEREDAEMKEVNEGEVRDPENQKIDDNKPSEEKRNREIPREGSSTPQQVAEKKREDEERKRTLILKGIKKPSDNFVRKILQSNQLTVGEEILNMTIRKIRGQEWVFLKFATAEAAEKCFSNRWRLGRSKFFLHRDLSFEERRKLKEEKEKRLSRNPYPRHDGWHPNGQNSKETGPWWPPMPPWWMPPPVAWQDQQHGQWQDRRRPWTRK